MVERLYVFMRSDLASMTVGKACAQVAHAASQAAFQLGGPEDTKYRAWELSPLNERRPNTSHSPKCFSGYGTTIVLDGGDQLSMSEIALDLYKFFGYVHNNWGQVVDPSYPVKDGAATHYVEQHTCTWFFANPDRSKEFREWLNNYGLYDGYKEIV